MTTPKRVAPIGIALSCDIEIRVAKRSYRARARWVDPVSRRRLSSSQAFLTEDEAKDWIDAVQKAARSGVDPAAATKTLAEYGEMVKEIAMRGIEPKTAGNYLTGWRIRVVPDLGHHQVYAITTGAVDRVVHGWIADGCGRSPVKNTLAGLVRIFDQAVRDGLIDRNPARITGWQREYRRAEDELDDPRSLALPDWAALTTLADALVARSAGNYAGWGEVVTFAACTAARIGEVSGVRVGDIDMNGWTWTLRRQTTPSPGGLADKGTKGKRARVVPLIVELRPMIERRIKVIGAENRTARLFTGPRGGRITTAVLRDATHWDEVVTAIGYEHLRRHDLRHTGLTWMADAGVPVHVLRKIAGHGSLTTTQRYLHPDRRSVAAAGESLSRYLAGWSQNGPRTEGIEVPA